MCREAPDVIDPPTIYLSLGSNIEDRLGNLRAAVEQLRHVMTVKALSSLYETAPVGPADQPSFFNLALAGETDLPPLELLGAVKEIEHRIGRRPTYRWGPRVVDIDILLYDDLAQQTETLTIPHPEMLNRAFVLVPLAEIAPALLVDGTNVADWCGGMAGLSGVRRVAGPETWVEPAS